MPKHMPERETKFEGVKYWEYNFRIAGVRYQISLNQSTGRFFYFEDPEQEEDDRTHVVPDAPDYDNNGLLKYR